MALSTHSWTLIKNMESCRFRKQLPSTDQLTRAIKLSGYHYLSLSEDRKARLEKKGIILTGGVAKGFAADRMMIVLNNWHNEVSYRCGW